ncbi:MAG TPA: hypothetical protein VFG86_04130, partial [Chloroflexota bacterium]|nr:hypothetical protein [Chloroflexota bacterium]
RIRASQAGFSLLAVVGSPRTSETTATCMKQVAKTASQPALTRVAVVGSPRTVEPTATCLKGLFCSSCG